METLLSQLPGSQALASGLNSVLRGGGATGGRITVIDRQPNIQMSTFASEIVTCRLESGNDLRLLCKYESGQRHDSNGHRGRVPYEAEVYRHVLRPLEVSTPKFYGAYKDAATGDTWLFIEYVEKSVRANQTGDPDRVMRLAARWIGRFHAINEARPLSKQVSFLTGYDHEYYRKWARRASMFAGHWRRRFPWLSTLCERYAEQVDSLLASPQTIIHGEYYPKNILVRGRVIRPVDWESAAIAAGEIDLASLTEQWSEEVVRQCKSEYQKARWPDGAPADFERRLGVAQLYLIFRWLGDGPDWADGDNTIYYYEQLQVIGERLGLI